MLDEPERFKFAPQSDREAVFLTVVLLVLAAAMVYAKSRGWNG